MIPAGILAAAFAASYNFGDCRCRQGLSCGGHSRRSDALVQYRMQSRFCSCYEQYMKAASNLRTTAIVLYATLAILWLAIPQSVTAWSRDFLPDFMQPYASAIAETVEAGANATRLPLLHETVRTSFQSATKK
jgi:hypothetical protein